LIPIALNKETIHHSLIIIALDWKKPWTFVDSLERWLSVVESIIKSIADEDGSRINDLKDSRKCYRLFSFLFLNFRFIVNFKERI